MNSYLIDRLRCDAAHALLRAEVEASVNHPGLKGRFRELLIDNLLTPWLPPYVGCGTGLILGTGDMDYVSGQEDIVLYDRSLSPPILASSSASEGVFLSNSALARIEVKSRLDSSAVRSFVDSSAKVNDIRVIPKKPDGIFTGTFNLLFAFHSDLIENKADPDHELRRVLRAMREANLDPLGGVVSMICIADRGFWKINMAEGGQRVWGRLAPQDPRDPVVWFVACVSTTTFESHAQRSGNDPSLRLVGGIGPYLPEPYVNVPEPY